MTRARKDWLALFIYADPETGLPILDGARGTPAQQVAELFLERGWPCAVISAAVGPLEESKVLAAARFAVSGPAWDTSDRDLPIPSQRVFEVTLDTDSGLTVRLARRGRFLTRAEGYPVWLDVSDGAVLDDEAVKAWRPWTPRLPYGWPELQDPTKGDSR